MALLNLTGHIFGRLTVLKEAAHRKNGRHWRCKCACGQVVEVRQAALRNSNTKSCGCLKGDVTAARNSTHGMAHTSEYTIWQRMKGRCTNPSNKDFARYGGRGIQVCEQWLDSFETFLADMGPRPPKTSLDRYPNNDGNYEPGNCRWATQRQQCRNKANNRMLTHNGVTMCLADWADHLGVKFGVLQSRLSRYGWSVERALAD